MSKMKSMSKQGCNILAMLQAKAQANDGHIKLSTQGGGVLPLSVEIIYGGLLSLAHYGELNGDLMRDPEMTFFKLDDKFYPAGFRNDYIGRDEESIIFDENGKLASFYPAMQRSEASFAETWLQNIITKWFPELSGDKNYRSGIYER